MKTKYLRLQSAFTAALLASASPAFAQAGPPSDAEHGVIVAAARLDDAGDAPQSGSVSAHAEAIAVRPVLLGVVVEPLSDELRGQLPPDAVPAGAGLVIREVRDHSPAAEAKLENGDMLLTWNGQPLKTPAQLRELVRSNKPGGKVKLAYLRDGQRHETKAEFPKPVVEHAERLEVRPGMPGRAAGGASLRSGEPGLFMAQPAVAIGVAVERIPDELRDQLPQLKPAAGLVIRHIMDKCDAASAGLQKGDILLSWDGDTLVHPEQLRVLVQAAKSGKEITIGYLRKGAEQQARLTLTEASKHPAPPRWERDAGAMKLERLLDEGDAFQLRMPPDERAQVLEKIRGIQQQIERMRKDVPSLEHADEGLTKEIERLSREIEQALNEAKDLKGFHGEALLLGPDGKMEKFKGEDLHKKVREAMRNAGVDENLMKDIDIQMKDGHAAGGAKVGGRITIVGPDGKVTERVFGSGHAEAKPAEPDAE